MNALLWARRLWPYATLVSLIVAAIAVMQTCHAPTTGEQKAAHRETVAAEKAAAQTTADFRAAVTVYDTTRKHVRLTDTNWVKVTLERADTAVRRAERALVARDTVESKLRTELAISERLRAPRITGTGSGGYDVVTQTYVAAADVRLRLVGDWSLYARGERRFVPGGSHLDVGLSHPLF